MSKKMISLTEGRKNLYNIVEEVQKPSTHYTFTVDGKPRAVLLSYDEFDSIMETMEIMSDPELMARIKDAEAEYERGEYISLDQLKKEMGYVDLEAVAVREKPQRKYVTPKKKAKK